MCHPTKNDENSKETIDLKKLTLTHRRADTYTQKHRNPTIADAQTCRHTDTQKPADTQQDAHRHTDTQTKHTHRHATAQPKKKKHGETHPHRHKDTLTYTQTQTVQETQKPTDAQKHTDRQTQTQITAACHRHEET